MAAIAGASGLINPSTIDLATSQADIERRRQLAMALLAGAGGMGQTQMAGNIAIRKSPWEFLARMGTAGIGGHDLRALNDEQQGLVSGVQKRQSDALSNLLMSSQGTPGTAPSTTATQSQDPYEPDQSAYLSQNPGTPGQAPDPAAFANAVAQATNAGVDPKIVADQLSKFDSNRTIGQFAPQYAPWNAGAQAPSVQQGQNGGGMGQVTVSGGGGAPGPAGGGDNFGIPGQALGMLLSGNAGLAAMGKEVMERTRPQNIREGAVLAERNPDGTYRASFTAPKLPEGTRMTPQNTIEPIPGGAEAAASRAGQIKGAETQAGLPGQWRKLEFKDGSSQELPGDIADQVVRSGVARYAGGPSAGPAPFPVTPAAPARAGGGGQGAAGRGAVLADEYRRQSAAGQVDPALATEISGLNRADRAAFDAAQSGAPGTPQVRPTSDQRPGTQPMPRNVGGGAPGLGGQSTGAKAEAEANGAIYAKQAQAVDERAFAANEATARNEAMLTALPAFKSGAGSELRLKAARLAEAAELPWLSKALMSGGNMVAQQVFNKDAYQGSLAGLKQVLSGQRITQQEVATNYVNSPNTSLNAESSEMLLKYQLGVAQWAKEMQQEKEKWTSQGSYKGFEAAWNRTHPVSAYVPSVEAMEKVFYPNGKPNPLNPSTKVNNQTRTGAVGGSGQAAPTTPGLKPGWTVEIH